MEGFLDIQRDGRIDGVVLAFRTGLTAGSARIVVILAGSARLQLAASGYLHFLDDRFPGLEFWHIWINLRPTTYNRKLFQEIEK